MVECPAGELAGFFMRFTIRDWLWLAALLAIAGGWYFHAWTLWIGMAMWKDEALMSHQEIKRLRAESSTTPSASPKQSN
jgi:hypothetical protein